MLLIDEKNRNSNINILRKLLMHCAKTRTTACFTCPHATRLHCYSIYCNVFLYVHTHKHTYCTIIFSLTSYRYPLMLQLYNMAHFHYSVNRRLILAFNQHTCPPCVPRVRVPPFYVFTFFRKRLTYSIGKQNKKIKKKRARAKFKFVYILPPKSFKLVHNRSFVVVGCFSLQQQITLDMPLKAIIPLRRTARPRLRRESYAFILENSSLERRLVSLLTPHANQWVQKQLDTVLGKQPFQEDDHSDAMLMNYDWYESSEDWLEESDQMEKEEEQEENEGEEEEEKVYESDQAHDSDVMSEEEWGGATYTALNRKRVSQTLTHKRKATYIHQNIKSKRSKTQLHCITNQPCTCNGFV